MFPEENIFVLSTEFEIFSIRAIFYIHVSLLSKFVKFLFALNPKKNKNRSYRACLEWKWRTTKNKQKDHHELWRRSELCAMKSVATGIPKLSLFWRSSDTLLVLEMCGDFHICATEAAVVSAAHLSLYPLSLSDSLFKQVTQIFQNTLVQWKLMSVLLTQFYYNYCYCCFCSHNTKNSAPLNWVSKTAMPLGGVCDGRVLFLAFMFSFRVKAVEAPALMRGLWTPHGRRLR